MKTKRFKDRVAVVTGGGGMICGAIARGLAAEGAKVAVWDLSKDAADAVVEEMCSSGGTAIGIECDVLDRAAVEAAAGITENDLGSIDILINGAGGSRAEATTTNGIRFSEILPDDLMDTLALNYLAAVLPSQVVAEGFARRKKGAILNIASIAGMRPLTKAIAYSNGKAALISFTRWLAVHMAQEYSPEIRVNALSPGFVVTEQNRFLLIDQDHGDLTERGEKIVRTVPMARFGQAEEMVGAALWLLSDDAEYVTGAVVPVDGGLTAYAGL